MWLYVSSLLHSVGSAGVSIGSEMSGGVSNVLVENVHVWDSRRGMRIKTAPGRGAYVTNVVYRNITLENVRVGIVIKTDYNEHPDEGFDPKAVPTIGNISYTSIHGHRVRVPVRIQGSAEIPVKNVTFHDMSIGIVDKKHHVFQCSFVQGQVIGYVFPVPCKNLDLYDERRELVKQSTLQNVSDIDYSFWQGRLIPMYYCCRCIQYSQESQLIIVLSNTFRSIFLGSFYTFHLSVRHVFKEDQLVYTVSWRHQECCLFTFWLLYYYKLTRYTVDSTLVVFTVLGSIHLPALFEQMWDICIM